MNRHLLASGLMILLIIVGAVWFYLNFERVTEREEAGLQGEALRNEFLAAQRLLQRMGVATRDIKQLAELETLPVDAALILTRPHSGFPPHTVSALLSWVARGGHLIVEAENYREKDALLDALNIERVDVRNQSEREPSAVKLPHAPQVTRVHFGYWQKLLPQAHVDYEFADASGKQIVHLKRGDGAVTVLPDLRFMSNDEIGKYDHAEFTWQLLGFDDEPRIVLVAARLQTPRLSDWLFHHAAAALALAAVLLVMWLWHVGPRFGPVKPDPPAGRRRLLDHLRASGRFHWKCGGQARLLGAARDTCLRKIAQFHPGVVDLPARERTQRLAAMSRLSAAEIDLALQAETHDPMHFTAAIRALQLIEDRLVRKI